MYSIYKRYQHWSSEGKVWTQWFSVHVRSDSQEEIHLHLKELKEQSKQTVRATNLDVEYEIREED